MNKFLLFSITITLCQVLADALHCLVCKQYKPGTGCLRGKSSCETEPGQQCKTVEVKKKNGQEFLRKGCSKGLDDCNQSTLNLGSFISSTCCDDQDFCNDNADILRCLVCKKFDPRSGCLQGKSFCETEPGQKCKTEIVRKKNGKEFQRTGCTNELSICDTTVLKFASEVTTTCCDHSHFCNGLPLPT